MPNPPETASLAWPAIQITIALLLIIGVIMVAFWTLRKFGPKLGLPGRGKQGLVSFAAHLPLGPRQGVAVVKFQGRLLVLGVTEHSINLLTETYDPDAPGAHKPFEDSLRQADNADRGPV